MMVVTTGSNTSMQSFSRDVGIGSSIHDFTGASIMILGTSSSVAGANIEKVLSHESDISTDRSVNGALSKSLRMLLILLLKKLAKLFAISFMSSPAGRVGGMNHETY